MEMGKTIGHTQYRKKLARIDGKLVTVRSVSAVANQLKVSVPAIRKWEARGDIPKSAVPGPWRYYTAGQTGLLRKLADFGRPLTGRPVSTRRAERAKLIAMIWARWDDL